MSKIRKGDNIVCKCCKKIFYVPFYRLKTARFCSLYCQNHKQYERPTFKCFLCEKIFDDSPSRKGKRKFCSNECLNKFQTDRKNDQKEKRRLSIIVAREKGQLSKSGASTRKFAFLKKESKCEICGYNEYKCCLDVHHIDSDPNNNAIENLSILCAICHRKVHRNIISINEIKLNIKPRWFQKKNSKLSEEKAKEIKILLKENKMTHKQISEIYGVKRELISKINQGKRWK